jgi:hypothetical protein
MTWRSRKSNRSSEKRYINNKIGIMRNKKFTWWSASRILLCRSSGKEWTHRRPDWLITTGKKHKTLCRQRGSCFLREFGVQVEYFAVQRRDHCQIMLVMIGIRNQLELEDRLNRLLSELGRVCLGLKVKLERELEGLGYQWEKVGGILTLT